ncbi:16S rRNA (cytosine(1402)-N(4))-methyltransferase RsmH [Methyloligella solikamskensis]|uniref:Ribosomal RNA small subunit methyltransferase H n=1 Tax=Methyloligella solikamskensis TaxID=1177756 RepID=A0ABW3JCC4_9HYPH
MMAGHGEGAVGGPARHIPVMLSEVIENLHPTSGETIIDGTFGAGGYTRAILEAADCNVVAIDRDPRAIAGGEALAEEFPDKLKLTLGRFAEMEQIAEALDIEAVNGIVLDLGVSSMQLDEAERGFSFMQDGPLDMRMGASGPTAAEIVNERPEKEIADILFQLGEERRSRAIAKAIVAARAEAPIERTGQLADLVEKVLGRKRDEAKHPATRTFQALRLYLNAELAELAEGLSAAERLLAPGGRLVVVTFHSLEDRIAKRFFASRSKPEPKGSRHMPDSGERGPAPSFELPSRKPIGPSKQEIQGNPRSRSARLRAGIRTEAPAHRSDLAALGLPALATPA